MLTDVQAGIAEYLLAIRLLRRIHRFSEIEAIDFIEFCERGEVASAA